MDAFEFITKNTAKDVVSDLRKAQCQSCDGTGECDDADPGDISFKTWQCKGCDGTGWNKQAVQDIIDAAKA